MDESIDSTISNPRSLIVRNRGRRSGATIVFNSFTPPYKVGACHFSRNIGTSIDYIESTRQSWDTTNWYHVAVTIDSVDGMKMYINNQLQISSNNSTSPTDFATDKMHIG